MRGAASIFIERNVIVLPNDNRLSVKQEAFCMHYAKTGNATESYIAAGYKAKDNNVARANAARLIANDNIKKRLQELAQEVKNDKIADVQEIQEYLTSVMRREKMENAVVTISTKTSFYKPDDEGKMRKYTEETEIPQLVEYPTKISDANKAAETLAKMQGAFDNKLKVEMTVPVFEGEDDIED